MRYLSDCLLNPILLAPHVLALQTPHQLQRRQPPTLQDAVLAAANVSCNDPIFVEPDQSTPGDRWNASRAGDLLAAVAFEYAQDDEQAKNHPSLTSYFASLANTQSNGFDCADICTDNDCSNYKYDCLDGYGPAFAEILASFSNMHNYYKGIVNNALTQASISADGDAFNIAEQAVKYNKPDDTLDILANILNIALIPTGGAGMVAGIIGKTALDTAARAATKSAQMAAWGAKSKQDFQFLATQFSGDMAFGMHDVLAKAQNPEDSAEGILKEAGTFQELATKVFSHWEAGINTTVFSLFMGTMTADGKIGNGKSNYASLLHSLQDGKWVDAVTADGAKEAALSSYLAQALPTAELQNDKVRPTIVIRPYVCSDSKAAKSDSLFQELIHQPASDYAVSIPEAPGACFFVVDANKDANGCTSLPSGGCVGKKGTLVELSGINYKQLAHPSGSHGTWGDITIEDYVRSAYLGWKNNGRNNTNMPNYLDDGIGSDLGTDSNIVENPLNAAGQWNSYFVVCGSDDPNEALSSIGLLQRNIMSAHDDWNFADRRERPYPCADDPN